MRITKSSRLCVTPSCYVFVLRLCSTPLFFLSLHFRHNLFCLSLWHFLIVAELHAVYRAALAHRAQRGRVAEHLGQGHARRDDMRVGALRHAADFPASRREVADDVAHVVGGRHDLHVHDRLEQDGVRLTGGLFHRHGPRDLERHFARVYVVVRPVHQLDYHVHHRIAGEHAVLERFLDALLDRADVLPRDHAAHDVVLEHEARPRLARRHVDDHVPVLAAAAGLADELALYVLDALAHRLAVGHLGPAHVGIDLELALHALDQDFQVQLTHPGDNGLGGLGVRMHAERGVFFGELLQRDRELVLVGLGLGLDGDRDHRLGELHRLEDDRVALVAQRVAGLRVLEPDGRGDVAGAHFFDLLALVGVHRSEEHTSELQSQSNLVCRLLLEKKNNNRTQPRYQKLRLLYLSVAHPQTES